MFTKIGAYFQQKVTKKCLKTVNIELNNISKLAFENLVAGFFKRL
jgi:hypothetical protein